MAIYRWRHSYYYLLLTCIMFHYRYENGGEDGLSLMALSLMALSLMALSLMALSLMALSLMALSLMALSLFFLMTVIRIVMKCQNEE